MKCRTLAEGLRLENAQRDRDWARMLADEIDKVVKHKAQIAELEVVIERIQPLLDRTERLLADAYPTSNWEGCQWEVTWHDFHALHKAFNDYTEAEESAQESAQKNTGANAT